jgi:hypothetical protein
MPHRATVPPWPARRTGRAGKPHPITPLDGEHMIELQDVVTYMLAIGDRNMRRAWQRATALQLEAAERNGSLDAVRRQVIRALLLDGKLDAAATEPAR